MARIKKTKYVILGLLAHEPMTGYDIKKHIEHGFSLYWSESFGQIYPALRELSDSSHVRQLSSRSSDSSRQTKVYEITPAGLDALTEYLTAPIDEDKMRNEMLLKTYFAENIDQEIILKHLRNYKEKKEEEYKTLCFFEKNLINIEDEKDHRYILYTVKCGKKVYRAFIEWCEETIADILAHEKKYDSSKRK